MKKSATLILLLIIYTSILLLSKYFINDLSISKFKIFYIGNLIPLIILTGNVIGILISSARKSLKLVSAQLIFYAITSIIILIASLVIITTIDLPDIYYWNFPIQKLVPAALFVLSMFLNLMIFAQLWLLVFDSKKGNIIQIFFSAGIIVVLLLIVTFLFTLNSKNSDKLITEQNLESAVVLGAAVWSKDTPSPLFRARIEKALELYNKNFFKKILLTGGSAPGELSEAVVAFNFLKDMGVDKKNLNYEEETSTTAEQIKFVALKFDKENSIVIISDAFHLARVLQISEFFDVQTIAAASEYSISWEKLLYYRIRESIALLIFWLFGI